MSHQLKPLWEDENDRIKDIETFLPISRRPKEYQYILNKLPPPPCNLFEIGCGRGETGPPEAHHVSQITKMLLYKGYTIHGVDLQDIWFKHKNFTYIRGNFLDVDMPLKQYDAGYAVQVISHIGMKYFEKQNEPFDLDADFRVMKKINKLLKTSAFFITGLPIAKNFTTRYVTPEGKKLLPENKGRIYDRLRLHAIIYESGLFLTNSELYRGWNPKLGDEPIAKMNPEENYMALLTIYKPLIK